jgi:hypothetical protein
MRALDFKSTQEKKLRKLWKEYRDTWGKQKEHGQWIEVEPYQRGWRRYFVPRPDIKNRTDIRWIRQALDLINNTKFCRNKDFIVKDFKGQYKAVEQRLGTLTEEKYNAQPQNVKKLFIRAAFVSKYTKQTYYRYVFQLEWYFEYKVEPNIVTHHWLPDTDWETHITELSHQIERNNWWPKIDKMLGNSRKYKEWRLSPYLRNKYGECLTEEDFDIIEDDNLQ